jgi:hypothetical protein
MPGQIAGLINPAPENASMAAHTCSTAIWVDAQRDCKILIG